MLLYSFGGDDLVSNKDVDQWLQRLHVLLWQKIIVHSHSSKMNEAAIQLKMPVNVPEWVVVMVVIEVSIATEHLFDDALAVVEVHLGKTRSSTNPLVIGARQIVHIRRWHRNRCISPSHMSVT